MKHILCVHLPQWPIDRLRRRETVPSAQHDTGPKPRSTIAATDSTSRLRAGACPEYPKGPPSSRPLALVHTLASRRLITHACPVARKAGVRPGMPLAEARALCPQLHDHPCEPHKDLRALHALARRMIRFSPTAALAEDTGIFLDVTGCQRLYGGWLNLLEQIAEDLNALHFHYRLAIAPTPGAAWALAAFGRNKVAPEPSPAYSPTAGEATGTTTVVTPDKLRDALALLPVEALRIEPQTTAALHHLGLDTIGQLLAIPRNQLPSRFGPQLLLRIDQTLGLIPEPIIPLRPASPIDAQIEFDGAIDSLETILYTIETLVARICPDLARLGHGARRLDLRLHRLYAPALTREVLFSRPSRNPKNLLRLLTRAIETLEIKSGPRRRGHTQRPEGRPFESSGQAPAQRHEGSKCIPAKRPCHEMVLEPEGFSAISLHVLLSEPVADEQFSFDNHTAESGRVHVDRLVENLTLRLGESAITHAQFVESHLPERASTFHPGPPPHAAFSVPPSAFTSCLRPLLLYPHPLELQVLVAPSQDREGRPISFNLAGQVHPVVHAVGPERIAGLWWEHHYRTRDYFFVEDDSARRWWLFRVRESHRWFLHGEFA